jgi:hypothetical protein
MKKYFILFFIFIFLLSFQDKQTTQKLLIGRWLFEKFDPSTLDSKTLKEANQMNKGMFLTFRIDGKFTSSQSGGPRQNNYYDEYKLFDNNFLVLGKDTTRIVIVNGEKLILAAYGRPQIYFKKEK